MANSEKVNVYSVQVSKKAEVAPVKASATSAPDSKEKVTANANGKIKVATTATPALSSVLSGLAPSWSFVCDVYLCKLNTD